MTINLATAQVETLRMGTLIVTNQPTGSSLPLEHTDVVAQVCGPLASVVVNQRFGNSFAHPVELAYLFPLPHEAAVVDFEFRIGQRVVRSEIQELNTARETYAQARAEGKRAGLLEERRSNLFSLELANVQPGETIIATVRYHERLRYDDGMYQFVFPMGLTPRFHADPAEVAAVDAPIASADAPIGQVDLSLAVDAGDTASDPTSPTHLIDVSRNDSHRFNVRLVGPVLPNKDFVLRYAVAAERLSTAAWTTSGEGSAPETALITVLPPCLTDDVEPAPREFVFVLDRSGSMSGGPLMQAVNALRACLRALGPQDTFAIQVFDDRIEWLDSNGSPSALPVTQAMVERADLWLGQIHARGGTDILEALEAALQLRADPERQRYVLFLTDGSVSAEDEALRRVNRDLGQARLFTFGIGPSVNRGLLARMAELGHGTAEFLQLDEDIETAIIRFQDRVAYPVLQDIQIAWEGATAWDVYPTRLPDLYNGQPLELVARFQRTDAGRLVLTGRRNHEPVRLEVDLPPPPSGGEPLITSAWVRARVTALLDSIRGDAHKIGALRGEIIGLSIQHRLLTPYTALVAVDSQITNQQGQAQRVEIALPLPEGLDSRGFGPIAGGAAPPPNAPPRFHIPAPSSPAPGTKPKDPMFGLLRRIGGQISDILTGNQKEEEEQEFYSAPPVFGKGSEIERILAELASEQYLNGAWGRDLETTAAVLLIFIRAGHTTHSGNYRRQLLRTLKLLQTAKPVADTWAALARTQAIAEMAAAIDPYDASLQLAANATVQLGIQAPSGSELTSLDALRAAALTRTVLPLAPSLLKDDQRELVQIWQKVMVAATLN